MSQTLTTFDMAALLDSDEAISEYLSQVLADGHNDEFLRAIGYVAKAPGMAQIAKDFTPPSPSHTEVPPSAGFLVGASLDQHTYE